MCVRHGRETSDEVPCVTARARVPGADATRTKSLGTKATPRNHTILGILERNLMCYLNQQVTCILEIYIYTYTHIYIHKYIYRIYIYIYIIYILYYIIYTQYIQIIFVITPFQGFIRHNFISLQS